MADGYENQAPQKFQGKFQAKVICCILGIGCLASWNSMLTIADYYYHVFPDYHPSRVLTVVYQPFALGTIVILAYHESKINTRKRNLIGYIIFTISTLLLIVLDLTTRGRGGIGPYIGLCAIVASFGLAEATVHGGMIGDLSLMCPELIQSFVAGMGAAGALTSAFRLMTKAAFENSNDGLRKGAMIFLAISALIQFLCVMLYAYVFPKLPIVNYYRRKAASEGSKTVNADLAAAGIQNQSYSTDDVSNNQRLSNKELLVQNIDYAVNLALIYLISLSIFPGFLYENTGQHGLGSWYALVLVAMYNCGNMVGRYTPLVEWLKIENRKGLTLAVLSRFLFIPAFYFTAKYGDQGWMIMLVSLLGLTTGHFNVCILITAPKGYNGPEKNALGNLLVVFLIGGIVAGTSLGGYGLLAGRCRETVFTGFDRLREARNVKQGSDEELIGIDLVVVDEKVSFPPVNLLVFSMGKVWWRALLPMQVSEAAAQIWTKSNPENIVFKLGVFTKRISDHVQDVYGKMLLQRSRRK